MKSNRGYVVWAFSKIGVMMSVLILTLLLYLIYKYVSCITASDSGNQVAGSFADALIDVYAAPAGYEVTYELPAKAQGYAYELTVINSTKKGVLASMNESRCQNTCGGAVLNVPFINYPVPVKNLSENETTVIIRNEGSGVSIIRKGVCCSCISVDEMHYDAGGPAVDDSEVLNDEYVVFKNNCAFSCDLADWTVKDRIVTRLPYSFGSINLGGNSEITLHSGDGVDSSLDVYWDSTTLPNPAIWNNDGDTLYLRDSSGYLCLEHTYTV
jgi:hypothetical protein